MAFIQDMHEFRIFFEVFAKCSKTCNGTLKAMDTCNKFKNFKSFDKPWYDVPINLIQCLCDPIMYFFSIHHK